MSYLIRDAADADLAGILPIYNDAVQNSTAIWNETLVDLANRRTWLTDRNAAGFPVLVAVDEEGNVLGYSSYGPWRNFDGFRHTVEHSVYVRGDQQGKGLGKALLRALIQRACQANLHVIVAAIERENAASIALHERLGFVITGQMPQVGRKFDRWLDLTFMQLNLEQLVGQLPNSV
ncbi:N-acetyltransferase family protein [Pseudomonas sp. PDM16]|uniref:GNAT family N-acetyltransferase n=1 Tax=Pseudomonas sp. PDM16 TaxID=2769292 RepID=UPI001780C2D7|nr:GNAT family N-acetyltransferase [Pseudomonas sp. PDM16]MBD9417309.1 N-acetyltransferase family protein [Pseudomonas sp. PDM16]